MRQLRHCESNRSRRVGGGPRERATPARPASTGRVTASRATHAVAAAGDTRPITASRATGAVAATPTRPGAACHDTSRLRSSPRESGRSPNRNRAIVAGIIIGVVVAGAAGFAWNRFGAENDNAAVAVLPAATAPLTAPGPTAPPLTESSTVVTQAIPVVTLQSVVTHLDSKLNQSAAEVSQLKALIGQFDPAIAGNTTQPCALSGAEAAAQIQPIIDGRKSMVDDLDRLAASATGTARQLTTDLRAAINLSLQSDYSYAAWMSANTSTDATNPCGRLSDPNWLASQDIAPRAGAAKQAFLAEYLPVAARYGVRADWTNRDF